MKKIFCWLKAIPHYIVTGKWQPHEYGFVSHVCTLNNCVIADMDKGCIQMDCKGCLFHRKQALRCKHCGKFQYYRE